MKLHYILPPAQLYEEMLLSVTWHLCISHVLVDVWWLSRS